MTQNMFVEAVGMIDTDLLEKYTHMENRLKARQKRRMPAWGRLLIAAACILLSVALLLASLPLAYVVNHEAINTFVAKSVDQVLFPLDGEQSGEVQEQELMLNWVEWEITEAVFAAMGAGTESSFIEFMKGEHDGLAGKTMQDIGEFLDRLYQYYLDHKNEIDAIIGESESETETEPEIETEIESETEIETEIESGTEIETEIGTELETEIETEALPEGMYLENGIAYMQNPGEDYYSVVGSWDGHESVVEIPATVNGLPVRYIAAAAFKGDHTLTKIILSEGIERIQERAFMSCRNLEQIVLPDSLVQIGNNAFQGCLSLQSIVIPESVTIMGVSLFSECDSLTEVTLPEGMRVLGARTFEYCTSLTHVDLPDSLVEIQEGAFYGAGLQEIEIPERVKRINQYAFCNAKSLETVILHDGIVEIGQSAFAGCEMICDLQIPCNLQVLDMYAFEYSGIRSVILPASLQLLGEYAFEGSGLTRVEIAEGISLPEGIFKDCANLEQVKLPSDLITIPTYAFYGCENLAQIDLPLGLKTIGTAAFQGCSALQSIELPESLKDIYSQAFQNCVSLESVYIPDGVQLRDSAFTGCKGLKQFRLPSETAIITEYMFERTGFEEFYVPDGVTKIDMMAFQNCTDLTKISLPVSLESVEYMAFRGCDKFDTIEFRGTIEQFKEIKIYYNSMFGDITVICTDGVTEIDYIS